MKIRIGTRGSRLAMIQTEMVNSRLKSLVPGIETEIVTVTTKGDRIQDRPISELGGAGAFAGELERALASGEIDIAVHSAKDMPVRLGEGLTVGCVLTRADPRDVLVTPAGKVLPPRPVIGTSSPRRRAGVSRIYPNAELKDIRGNVETRLEKLAAGEYDAIVLAAAGLKRLGLYGSERFSFKPFDLIEFLPAPCQAIIAVESRIGELRRELDIINDRDSFDCFETERKVLELAGAGCSSPIGAYAHTCVGKLSLYITADGTKTVSSCAETSQRFELAERLVSRL
ncbi:MAG: hydroxymethylbilane synthase [Ruminococcus sp.]|nr:hydroxymethylbilane synthase [Ruminococcus sp.]